MKDLSQIRFVRINEAALVPKYLLDQAPDMPFSAADFYGNYIWFTQSPFSFLYSIIDRADLDDPQKGVMWLTVDPMSKNLIVNFVSVKKDYQSKTLFPEIIVPYIIKMQQELKLRKIFWATTRPKAFEKLGGAKIERGRVAEPGKYRRAKLVLMEMEVENGQE